VSTETGEFVLSPGLSRSHVIPWLPTTNKMRQAGAGINIASQKQERQHQSHDKKKKNLSYK